MGVEMLVVVAVIVVFAGFGQAVAGFGFALLMVTPLGLLIEPKDAISISLPLLLVSGALVAWSERQHIIWPAVRSLMLGTLGGLPLGLLLLRLASADQLRLGLAAATAASVALLMSGFTVSSTSRRLEYGAGFVAGVLATSLSTSGPPTVICLQARTLEPHQFRPTTSIVLSLVSTLGAVMFAADGRFTSDVRIAVLLGLPALVVGSRGGERFRDRIDPEAFRRGVLLFLLAAALASAITALR